ncbi:SDR family NAD(P)-dependent oxidoreductase [Segniliparus rugosus]|uniref:Ketoreductase domain-containing protein n=1 Tax=Segniliparus rugosus (strain ATCC BAA-974 / DSM 45345 / CCUG 50838 / CIP 108380 / JCM 13579 / CDC 945) TaxID=679197 RepID=E5XVB5_SEGRC|nr:SDR family NAD(P)-dependent oxidoreductase [Segniliparus rugosus]EFV11728.1 hypothetical protein HMPREF9336_03437 [Segniliparus rugosus ATCC BAA-974]
MLISRALPQLHDQAVVVTGAGNGIGAEVARGLIARGAAVALVDRDEEAVCRLAEELGPRAAAFFGDVTVDESIRAAASAAAARFGRIDAVVANAGVVGRPASVAALRPGDFERVVEVNLFGVYRTVAAMLPHLAGGGYILAVSSIAAVIPGPTISAYVASKAGVEAFSRALRIELRQTGIRVGIAYFGLVETGLARDLTQSGLGAVLATFPKALATPIPVRRASDAIVLGVERRSRRVCAPWWVPALLDLRPLAIAADRVLERHPAITAMTAAERRQLVEQAPANDSGAGRKEVGR